VRSRFTRIAEMANKKLSFMSRRNNMTQIYELLHNAQRTMHNAKGSKHNAQCTTHNAQCLQLAACGKDMLRRIESHG